MVLGVLAAVVAVVLYAAASVLQRIGSVRVTREHGETSVSALAADRTWLAGVGVLAVAFGTFAVSTRILPLVLAEVIRAVYPIVTVVFDHLAERTRIPARELGGAALVLVATVLLVWSGGSRGDGTASLVLAAAMLAVLVAVVVASTLLTRSAPPSTWTGVGQAALSGLAFVVVDIGVRSLPEPFSLLGALETPACWVGALAAPVGLVLFSRSLALVSAGLATVVLTIVNVLGASVWAGIVFHDTTAAGPAQVLVAVLLAAAGVRIMTLAAPGSDPAPR